MPPQIGADFPPRPPHSNALFAPSWVGARYVMGHSQRWRLQPMQAAAGSLRMWAWWRVEAARVWWTMLLRRPRGNPYAFMAI